MSASKLSPPEQPSSSTSTPFRSFTKAVLSGGITGSLTMLVVFPTELVKTQCQLVDSHGKPKFTGPVNCFIETLRASGFRGLYTGLPVLFVGNFATVATRFGTQEFLKAKLMDSNGKLSKPESMFCGLGAGVAEALFAVIPIESLKVAFIADQKLPSPRFRNAAHAASIILKEEGFFGLYKGVSATILKQGSNQMLRFLVADSLRDHYKQENNTVVIPKVVTGLIGAVAGAVSVYGNTPFDVIKTRMQGNASLYSSTAQCTRDIWKKEGIKGFYKGTVPRLARVCLDVSLSFIIYDTVRGLVEEYFKI